MTAEDCNVISGFKNRIGSPSTDNKSYSKLTMDDLTSAIHKMKHKGDDSPDGIPPTFLKALSPIALQELLEIFNTLFLYVDCPRIRASYKFQKLVHWIVKLHPIDQSALCRVSLNFSNVFKQVFKKDIAVKTKFYKLCKQSKMASKRNQCNVLYWLSSTSGKLSTLFGGKSYCHTCSAWVSWLPSSAGYTTSSMIDKHKSNFSVSSAAVDGVDKV